MVTKNRLVLAGGAAAVVVALVGVVALSRPANGPGATTPEPAANKGTVWVADEYGNSVTVIDAATNKPVTKSRPCKNSGNSNCTQ